MFDKNENLRLGRFFQSIIFIPSFARSFIYFSLLFYLRYRVPIVGCCDFSVEMVLFSDVAREFFHVLVTKNCSLLSDVTAEISCLVVRKYLRYSYRVFSSQELCEISTRKQKQGDIYSYWKQKQIRVGICFQLLKFYADLFLLDLMLRCKVPAG